MSSDEDSLRDQTLVRLSLQVYPQEPNFSKNPAKTVYLQPPTLDIRAPLISDQINPHLLPSSRWR